MRLSEEWNTFVEQPHAGAPIRVILAEDHALVREGTRRLLEATGEIAVVDEAADGAGAVAAVVEHQPDVAIIDIGMPGMNGIEATRQVKKSHPQVSVLVLTMHDDDQFIFGVIEAGAAGYLLKDVHGDELVAAVRAVHAGESVLHPALAHRVLSRLASGIEAPEATNQTEPLTDRELEVLRLAARGLANKEIAGSLGVSVRTVEAHLSHVFRKLELGSRTEAVLHGLRQGWFSIEDLGTGT
ncbi:MAG TPA: response regulator transcription factor [Acidimicrobiia bacterium]|nr:response regulator transcription factor [Acidimicrobiia bacterium]